MKYFILPLSNTSTNSRFFAGLPGVALRAREPDLLRTALSLASPWGCVGASAAAVAPTGPSTVTGSSKHRTWVMAEGWGMSAMRLRDGRCHTRRQWDEGEPYQYGPG